MTNQAMIVETDVTSAEQRFSKPNEADYGANNTFSSSDFLHKVTIDYDDDKKTSFIYRIEILVGQFKPKDFKIKLKENVLTVSGNRLVESNRDGENSTSRREETSSKSKDDSYDSIKSSLTSKSTGYASKLKQTEQFKRIINLPEFIETKTATCYLETYEKAPNVLKVEAKIKKGYNSFVENLLKAKPECLASTSKISSASAAAKKSSNDYSLMNDLPDVTAKRESFRPQPQRSFDAEATAAYNAGVYSAQASANRFPNKRFVDNRINISSFNSVPTSQTGKVRSQSLKSLERNARTNENECVLYGSGVLKYKFDLKNFESKNISITIRKNNVLTIKAFSDSYDSYGRVYNEFSREIILPDNAEVHNIRNCFDEYDGVLRIEVPLKTSKFRSTNQLANNRDSSELDDSDSMLPPMGHVSASQSHGNLNLQETYNGPASRRPPNDSYFERIEATTPRAASKYATRPQPMYSSLNQPPEFYSNPPPPPHLPTTTTHDTSYQSVDNNISNSNSNSNNNQATMNSKSEMANVIVENDDKTCNLNDSIKNLPEYTNDKYLELIFDLTGYKFQNTNIILNKSMQKVLIIKAFKYVEAEAEKTGAAAAAESPADPSQKNKPVSIVRKLFIRKYILPDWIDSEHIKIIKNDEQPNQDNKNLAAGKKNLLIVHLPIVN